MGFDGQYSNPDAGDEYPDGARERDRGQPSADGEQAGNLSEIGSRQDDYDSLASNQYYQADAFRPWTAAKPAIERLEWQAPLEEGHVDRVGLGVIDERVKKFSLAERRIAEYVAAGGPAVVAVSEGYGVNGRTPDARVDAVPVELIREQVTVLARSRSTSADTSSTMTTSSGPRDQISRCTPSFPS